MDSPALDELTRRVNGGGVKAAASLTLEASLARIARRLDQEARDEAEYRRAVVPVVVPPVAFTASAAGLSPAVAANALLGPEDGLAWDVRRVSLDGWSSADSALNVKLYREQVVGTGVQGQSQNFLQRFNGNVGNQVWAPSGGLILRSPDTLVLASSAAFTTTVSIYLAIEVIQIELDWLWKYLL